MSSARPRPSRRRNGRRRKPGPQWLPSRRSPRSRLQSRLRTWRMPPTAAGGDSPAAHTGHRVAAEDAPG
eukprot:4517847-Alexandrium_andersonii.AAC.1